MDVNFIAPKRNIKSSGSDWETNTLQFSSIFSLQTMAIHLKNANIIIFCVFVKLKIMYFW